MKLFFMSIFTLTLCLCALANIMANEMEENKMNIPENFISFHVPGLENEMRQIRNIYYEAYMNPGPAYATFWDPWLPAPTLTIADVKNGGLSPDFWKKHFLDKKIDKDGYVSTHQHFSHALDDGWPFPLFWQLNGKLTFQGITFGYLFQNDPKTIQAMMSYYTKQMQDQGLMGNPVLDRFDLYNLSSKGIVNEAWELETDGPSPSITTKDGFMADSFCCPFVQIRLSGDLDYSANPMASFQWQRAEDISFSSEREIKFSLNQPSGFDGSNPIKHCIIKADDHPEWTGKIKKIRFTFPNGEYTIRVDSLFSAFNTRHQMNAFSFLIGSIQTFDYTGDVDFLKQNIDRMRSAMTHAQINLGGLENNMVKVSYKGHDGIPGYTFDKNGRKKFNYGHSIGGNYWDILPFGNLETYSSYYYYYSLLEMAKIEKFIKENPKLEIGTNSKSFDPNALVKHAKKVAETVNKRMWNKETKRFYGTEDVNGDKWDYGFTFVNMEAVYYGLADKEHSKEIMDWVSGLRIVEGDTSVKEDIYRWELAPRATTLKNNDWYFWGWEGDHVPWGTQVQDGGAIFYQSFFDMMSRIKVYGAENAWSRFEEILKWYAGVEKAGGYRAYYADSKNGNSLQGGGTAGGIGIDAEFLETILVPYTMIEGFLGFKAAPQGFEIKPNLPAEWKSYEVKNLTYRGTVLNFFIDTKKITIDVKGTYETPLEISVPKNWKIKDAQKLDNGDYKVLLNNNRIVIER